MDKIKVCILMPSHWSGSKGGAELQSMYITQHLLQKNDVEVHYICRNFTKAFSSETVHKIPTGLMSKYSYAIDRAYILKTLSEIKPDYIYQRVLCSYTGIAAKFCQKTPTKMIFHIANSPDVEPQTLKFSRRFMFDVAENYYRRYGINNADYIIAQAHYQAESLKQYYHRECALIMPNISPDIIAEKRSARPSKKIILWVANVKPQKGPEKFLEIASYFQDRPDLEFHMVGKVSTRYANQIKQSTTTLKNVVFHGELDVSDVNTLMADAFIFVNTSDFEGFPNTFIQAWLNETPVVSLNVNPDDLISKHNLGYFCRTQASLLSTIKRCADDSQRIAEAGSKCRTFALDYFSLKNADNLYQLIQEDAHSRRCENAIS